MGKKILFADRICELPNDILVIILSHLTMKEAARTTILSRRYKSLWTHTTGSLDFDGSKILWTIKFYWEMEILEPEPERDRPAFISWVNQILNSHKGATIDGFRVHFDLDSSSRLDIDSWIDFALQKRARRLELDLEQITGSLEDIYHFPVQSLIGHPTINSLTYIKLNYVDVTRELLEYLLSNCPFLEFVCVRSSKGLVGVKVSVASLKLKYLEVSHCDSVEFLEISSAINLTTLRYSGPIGRVCFKNAPNLADVSFGGLYCEDIVKRFHRHSIPFSQIEKLELDLRFSIFESFDEFPELKNLKQLQLIVMALDRRSLLPYTSLLEKFPMLYRHYVHFNWFNEPEEIEIQEKKCNRLESLKLVELCAFRGSRADVELATYLVTNAPALEKISIDTRHPSFVGTVIEVTKKENLAAKECARQLLSTKLLPGVKFLVL